MWEYILEMDVLSCFELNPTLGGDLKNKSYSTFKNETLIIGIGQDNLCQNARPVFAEHKTE